MGFGGGSRARTLVVMGKEGAGAMHTPRGTPPATQMPRHAASQRAWGLHAASQRAWGLPAAIRRQPACMGSSAHPAAKARDEGGHVEGLHLLRVALLGIEAIRRALAARGQPAA
eukprot:3694392-Prymnesium_polylepis.1